MKSDSWSILQQTDGQREAWPKITFRHYAMARLTMGSFSALMRFFVQQNRRWQQKIWKHVASQMARVSLNLFSFRSNCNCNKNRWTERNGTCTYKASHDASLNLCWRSRRISFRGICWWHTVSSLTHKNHTYTHRYCMSGIAVRQPQPNRRAALHLLMQSWMLLPMEQMEWKWAMCNKQNCNSEVDVLTKI